MVPEILIFGAAIAGLAFWFWQRSRAAITPAAPAPGAGSEPQYTPPYLPPYSLPSLASTAAAHGVSGSGLQNIKTEEGLTLTAKPDAGGKSIGYGHHVQPGEVFNGPITIGRANQLFASDVARVEHIINSQVRVPLSQDRYDALADLVFNEGHIPPTLLAKLNAGDYAGAQAEFARNVYSQGHINPVLVARRQADANLWSVG